MKSLIRVVIGLAAVVVLVAAGLLVVPRLLYILPPFQSWVAGQIGKQSGGIFSFESIRGNAFEAQLSGAQLDLSAGQSHVVQAQFDDLSATFELFPVAWMKIDLKELNAIGGEVVLKLTGGDYEQVRLPLTAEKLVMKDGRLVIQNLQGFECLLEGCQLTVIRTEQGKKGEFTATSGKVGIIDLTGISGSFEFGAPGLKVTSFQATMPGESALTLEGRIALNEDGAPVQDASLTVNTRNVQTLLAALGYSERFSGSADVEAAFSGIFRPDLKNISGSGSARLSGISATVKLPSYPGFDGSGIFNELKKISNLNGEVPFELKGDQITVSSLAISNDKVKISGDLNIRYNKSIDGKQTALVSPALAAGIPSVAKDVFQKNDDGWTSIPFNFTGTTSVPAVNAGSVVSKALVNPVNTVKGVGGIFGGLFGGGKKKEEAGQAAESPE
ncbi:MAG: AsmA-like C-terminal region-containing protein [Verrucomicrobiota bacterium]